MDLLSDKFDIIIEGGQSNAEGSGMGPVDDEYIPSPDILYLEAEKTVSPEGKIEFSDKPFSVEIAKERPFYDTFLGDLALTFSEEYIKRGLLKKDRKILIIRAAVGGTGFQRKQWGIQDILYLKMLEMTDYALSLNPENRVVAFLWHQGEHDAWEGNTPDNYHKQLLALVDGVRSRYGKNLPLVAGDFVNEWKNSYIEITKPIVDIIRQVVNECGNARFVETADLPSNNQKLQNGDGIHFCRQSLHDLGRRYFEAFKSLLQN